ncbi:carbamoyl-phosphate synthase large subunit [Ruminococcaceae bacterium YRB3002]|nr:carbamoyl-phosphate synthase large subunit [Ruminococcaceae bacterium YRB3002]
MPLDQSIRKVLVIGSGPIVIGQAAEFDYAGTQACRALREDGVEIVLINSNPATIMTDKTMADKIYLEPLTLTTVKRIIETERPNAILSGLGGQTALTLCMELAKDGFLEQNNVKLLGSSPECIDKAEDRQMFKDTMESIGQPCIPSKVVNDVDSALAFAKEIGYPVIVRPAFTLGGSGGGIAQDEEELHEIARNGLAMSPITQVLIEKCISGWKEIEFEVIRDKSGNAITVCSMENLDPVGVHTGDSIVIAPAVTLADKEYQMLRSASLKIVEALGVEGGCNCQFALHPTSFEYAVIEVNPRVSRSSALASKATGYPIAKVATKIALGYRLDEIRNAVTGNTYAAFEPALDYVAVKFPKWPFDKFVYAKRDLGTQMKATGEVMAISDSFESALMKAVRGAEISSDTLRLHKLSGMSDEEIREGIGHTTDERIFYVAEGLYRGISVDEIHEVTMIDRWFLNKIKNLMDYEHEVTSGIDEALYVRGKKMGYLDRTIASLSGADVSGFGSSVKITYKMVDTCAGEFEAVTPYFYGTYNTVQAGGENEADLITDRDSKTVIVIGSGPIRIGQGIEFDYAAVHCVNALRKLGYRVVIINNNPETVSTDFDTGDRLYFEPLTPEDVMNIIREEDPFGVVVAFGGQTAIKLTKTLAANNVNIIGTSADSIDMAEDRERFDALLERLDIARPKGFSVLTKEEAFEAAHALEYPILLRPSYVLGGQNMTIAFHDEDVDEYMDIILSQGIENPVLIDKYIQGREIEVDAIYDGHDVLIPGIMEHIERAGIHSGDSIAVYPAKHIYDRMAKRLVDTTKALCEGLSSIGIVNIQYIVKDDKIYVIEVNPRASRTVPYMSKVTGVMMVDCAIRVSLGEKLADMDYGTGFYRQSPYTCVKVPVFSFEKLTDVDTQLGPEMKSTGEVLGVGRNLSEALYKGLIAAGYKMYKHGGVLITVRNSDKSEMIEIAKKFSSLGFALYATDGCARAIRDAGMEVETVHKIHESDKDNTMTLLESGKVNYIISTSAKGRLPARDSVKLRRRAVMLGIPCLTAIDTADALADSLMSRYSEINTELVDINNMREKRRVIKFTKMQGCGNDYIYIDCLDKMIASPESLSVYMSDRHFGVGGDGIVLIAPSRVADCRMIMYNLDGSEGAMCGNAIRCVGKYMYDEACHKRKHMTVETKSGIKKLELMTLDDKVVRVRVDMGRAELTPSLIPVALPGESVIDRTVRIGGSDYNITCVSMGNPHAVVFTDLVDVMDLEKIGPSFETDPLFPSRVNTEFVKVIDDHTIKMRVWERGSGETLACGTGACAAAVAACLNGYCAKDTDIKVILRGGDLIIRYTDDAVYMTGNCEKVFAGEMEI